MTTDDIELNRLIRKLKELSISQTSYSIHKIPRRLCNVNNKAYEPEMLAIGPYHREPEKLAIDPHFREPQMLAIHRALEKLAIGPYNRDKAGLKEMEELKLRYMQSFLHRNRAVTIEHYWSAVGEMEKRARNCYTEPIGFDESAFVKMLVLDGSFIIELITPRREIPYERTMHVLQRDLILLENQIPFFVLCKLFDLNQGPGNHGLLKMRVLEFCKNIFPGKKVYPPTSRNVEHILDLVHSNWCPPITPHHNTTTTQASQSNFFIRLAAPLIDAYTTRTKALIIPKPDLMSTPIYGYSDTEATVVLDMPTKIIEDETESMSMSAPIHGNSTTEATNFDQSHYIIPSVVQLIDANVTFKKKEYNGCVAIFDVEFKEGVMLMPVLIIADETESMLRNLIAFEQYFPIRKPTRVTAYALLLDRLINSSKDVQILSQNGIIENHLGSDQEVVNFVNRLTVKIGYYPDNFEYADIFHRLNKYHKKGCNRAVAVLRQDYCSSPWANLSIAAACVLLLLTIAQTYFAARG